MNQNGLFVLFKYLKLCKIHLQRIDVHRRNGIWLGRDFHSVVLSIEVRARFCAAGSRSPKLKLTSSWKRV